MSASRRIFRRLQNSTYMSKSRVPQFIATGVQSEYSALLHNRHGVKKNADAFSETPSSNALLLSKLRLPPENDRQLQSDHLLSEDNTAETPSQTKRYIQKSRPPMQMCRQYLSDLIPILTPPDCAGMQSTCIHRDTSIYVHI